MRKNTEISNEQYKKLINEFYSYFETGYAFEEFLKVYLEKIGLDEVSVTQRSRDGGIDLKARRNGVGGLSGADEVDYCVQAKRNAPNSTISVSKIRELKGIIQSGQKGLFITTAKFSNDAVKEATTDLSRPVILVDGKALVDSCIEHELGFVFIPVFSKAAMDKLSEKQYRILWRHAVDGLTYEEIAAEMGIRWDTVREHYHVAVKKVKKFF